MIKSSLFTATGGENRAFATITRLFPPGGDSLKKQNLAKTKLLQSKLCVYVYLQAALSTAVTRKPDRLQGEVLKNKHGGGMRWKTRCRHTATEGKIERSGELPQHNRKSESVKGSATSQTPTTVTPRLLTSQVTRGQTAAHKTETVEKPRQVCPSPLPPALSHRWRHV